MSPSVSSPPFACLLLCAGEGTRLGFPIPKAYIPLRGLSLFAHAAYALLETIDESDLFIVVSADHRRFHEHIMSLFPKATLVIGGAERHLSVINGLQTIEKTRKDISGVFIHDACRPFVPQDVMARLAAAVSDGADACAPALPCRDTIKLVDGNSTVKATLPRHDLRAVQTPQLLSMSAIKSIIAEPDRFLAVTDDLSFVEQLGRSVTLVDGDAALHKLTDAADYSRLIAMHDRQSPCRPPRHVQATGIDAHAYGDEGSADTIMLGGIAVPFTRRIIGHSDGDVVLHALTDALLGCCAARDIGYHFSDSSAEWKNADSRRFLTYALNALQAHGYVPEFVDMTVLCQQPYLSAHIARMQCCISILLFGDANYVSRVSVKATTTDHLGFLGRTEGLACVATLSASYEK